LQKGLLELIIRECGGKPMNTKYKVELNEEQKQNLENITSSGTYPARQIKRAQILLKSDIQVNWTYEQISAAFDVSEVTIAKVRKTFVEQGLEAALHRKKPDREYEHALDGDAEAHLIALACSQPPAGREHWSLRLLQNRFVKLRYTDNISHETIRRVLKKKKLSLG
jgi:transposase